MESSNRVAAISTSTANWAQVRLSRFNCPVYMSGYTGQAVGAHGALEEGSFFLQKPFSRDGLVSKVRLALDSGPAERPEEAPAVPYLNQKSGEPTCKES